MIKLLQQLPTAKTKQEKQELSAKIVAKLPEFIKELGELEQKYYKGLKTCVDSVGSKSGGEVLIKETDIHKKYMEKRRVYETIRIALPVLSMYTLENY